MSLKRVTVGFLARAHGLDEILLMGIIGEVALVLGDQLVVRAEDLPAAAVAPQVHHGLGAVDLGAAGILRPERPIFAIPHIGAGFLDIIGGVAAVEGEHEVAIVVNDGLELGGLALTLEGIVAANAADRLGMAGIAQGQAGQINDVAAVIGKNAAAIGPEVAPAAAVFHVVNAPVVGDVRRRPQPGVPVQAFGNVRRIGVATHPAPPQHVVGLDHDYLAQLAALDVIAGRPAVIGATILRADLHDPLVLLGGFPQLAPLPDRRR